MCLRVSPATSSSRPSTSAGSHIRIQHGTVARLKQHSINQLALLLLLLRLLQMMMMIMMQSCRPGSNLTSSGSLFLVTRLTDYLNKSTYPQSGTAR